jgi:hypothetical protein
MLFGIWWITSRRAEVQEYEQKMRDMNNSNNGNE